MTDLSSLSFWRQRQESSTTTETADKLGLLWKRSHLTISCCIFLGARFISESLIIVCMSLRDPEGVPSKMCMTCKYWFVFVPKEKREEE